MKFSSVVIDTSAILSFLYQDEHSSQEIHDAFTKLANGTITFYASTLLPFEVTNGLRSGVLRKRITQKDAKALIQRFKQLPIIFMSCDVEDLLQIAFEKQLSVYDASYIAVSRTCSCPLITLDKKLKEVSHETASK